MPPAKRIHEADVAVVGGGLSGSLAAARLGDAGHRVILVDRYAVVPDQFRVEKIAGPAVDQLRRLNLLDCIAAHATAYEQVVNIRRGQVIDHTHGAQFGILYPDMVRAVRAHLPGSVQFVPDRVVKIATSVERQQISLASGDVVHARLVVMATGMGDLLCQELGIARRVICERHSITFGFNLAPAAGRRFEFDSLTAYGDHPSDRIDYLTLFPIGELMRANLFTYRDHRDPWVQDMRREPKATLLRTLPGLSHFLGEFHVVGAVQSWIMNLCQAEDPVRDGVVLIGDVFQTSSPPAGVGTTRLLNDVERLCDVHLPRWLACPGMELAKIAEFYRDPVKRLADRSAWKDAHYRRQLTIGGGLHWSARRAHGLLRRRLLQSVKGLSEARGASAEATG